MAAFGYPREQPAQREDRGRKRRRDGSPSLGFSSEQGGQENLIARDSRFEVAPPMFSAISTRYHYGIGTLPAISFLRIRSPGQLVTLSGPDFIFFARALVPFKLTHYPTDAEFFVFSMLIVALRRGSCALFNALFFGL